MVVGAGPAGLTAARELAEAGAQVTVLDDGARPGGQFALAERMKSTPDFHRFAEWSAEENARLGIDVRLGTRVDTSDVAALARETGADAVVLATGGFRPAAGFPGGRLPERPGRARMARRPPRRSGTDGDVPEAVTIWGADSVAMSVADTLADRGTAVLLVGPQEVIAPESGRRAKILAVPRLEANPRVRIRLGATIEEYDGARGAGSAAASGWTPPGPLLVSRSVAPAGRLRAGPRTRRGAQPRGRGAGDPRRHRGGPDPGHRLQRREERVRRRPARGRRTGRRSCRPADLQPNLTLNGAAS